MACRLEAPWTAKQVFGNEVLASTRLTDGKANKHSMRFISTNIINQYVSFSWFVFFTKKKYEPAESWVHSPHCGGILTGEGRRWEVWDGWHEGVVLVTPSLGSSISSLEWNIYYYTIYVFFLSIDYFLEINEERKNLFQAQYIYNKYTKYNKP